MQVIQCSAAAHAPAVLEILNEAIAHSTALYEYQPRTLENIRDWFADKQAAGFPVIGVEQAGALVPLVPDTGIPASNYRFRLRGLCLLAAQCGVANMTAALDAIDPQDDEELDG